MRSGAQSRHLAQPRPAHGRPLLDEAAWWFITMERSARPTSRLGSRPTVHIAHESAELTRSQVGSHIAGWFSFQPSSTDREGTAGSFGLSVRQGVQRSVAARGKRDTRCRPRRSRADAPHPVARRPADVVDTTRRSGRGRSQSRASDRSKRPLRRVRPALHRLTRWFRRQFSVVPSPTQERHSPLCVAFIDDRWLAGCTPTSGSTGRTSPLRRCARGKSFGQRTAWRLGEFSAVASGGTAGRTR